MGRRFASNCVLHLWFLAVAAAAVALFSGRVLGADVFYKIPLKELAIAEGQWPAAKGLNSTLTPAAIDGLQSMEPSLRLEGGGEAYIDFSKGWRANTWAENGRENDFALIRAEAGVPITGVAIVPASDFKSMVRLRFTAKAMPSDDARTEFYREKYDHYESLLISGDAGAAWYRHQADSALAAIGDQTSRQTLADQFASRLRIDSLDSTYNLFTGGRALSENLQLDRAIPAGRRPGAATVALDTIPGVQTKEMDWTPLIKGKQPAVDPLAAYVPIDQHVIFFPTFDALSTLIAEADSQGTPVLQAMEPQASDARVKQRYERQLGLSMTEFGRLLGPRLIKSVAVTGSDGYLRVGSDIAILFEAKDSATLAMALKAQINMARQREPTAEAVEGKLGTITYTGARSPDRAICSYVACLGDSNVIVVTNSLKQLERLAAVQQGAAKAVAAAPEYTFFRDRYTYGDADESAFIVLTDATIRRWSSARWRILDSRRTQAAAVMADLQAEHAAEVVSGKAAAAALTTDRYVPDMNTLRLTDAGAVSSTYGSLQFMTPIVELQADKVSEDEAQLYDRWREGYERYWSNFFDPIAIRLSVRKEHVAADLTVMPLINISDYGSMIDLTKGVKLAPDGADPHDAIVHFAMALNHDSSLMKDAAQIVNNQIPGLKIEPFSWVGKSAAIYVDDDPIWKEVADAPDKEQFLRDNYDRVPIALYIANESPLKLGLFMLAVRGMVDGTAPGSAVWETLHYNDRAYVRVSSKGEGSDKIKVYYATTPEALVVTLNENVLKRALDRQIARAAKEGKPATAPTTVPATAPPAENAEAANRPIQEASIPASQPSTQPTTQSRPWLGESAGFQIDLRRLNVLGSVVESYGKMQTLAWSNITILNEWKRLYPDRDPVKVHERLWQVRLQDPAGGKYVWNEQYQTMESTTYGHPNAPKNGPALPPQLENMIRANLGITFEEQGLRARAVLERGK